ncbi:hypothetical protein KFL_002220230 [Klebsormidium nitens]|uniref:Matrin-type domain-containing protein n=1 Tax=Klebsormidium nitens TaxID=105231 RepID=A0A1Y1I6X8_KLENI|nr:hypothetical protein KFL_002220230 [Klebsormidium nitens]|eukprot:GAQ85179.1 hypothetical protein KFL_002220230 [Klebsormidium nitens]
MTEYWVSQKQHFCEYCKTFIANNAASKGMHENGLRHKENVAKRLADMRRRNVVEKREKEQVDRDLERIEWKARRQYEKDLAQQSAAEPASVSAGPAEPEAAAASNEVSGEGWILDEKTGYYFDAKTKYTYDPNSGLYYTELTGRWTTQEEAAQASSQAGEGAEPVPSSSSVEPANGLKGQTNAIMPGKLEGTGNGKAVVGGGAGVAKKSSTGKSVTGLQKSAGATAKAKEVGSSLAAKRKRESDTPKVVTAEEAAALAAREAAKKRLEERTKKNYGFTFN